MHTHAHTLKLLTNRNSKNLCDHDKVCLPAAGGSLSHACLVLCQSVNFSTRLCMCISNTKARCLSCSNWIARARPQKGRSGLARSFGARSFLSGWSQEPGSWRTGVVFHLWLISYFLEGRVGLRCFLLVFFHLRLSGEVWKKCILIHFMCWAGFTCSTFSIKGCY